MNSLKKHLETEKENFKKAVKRAAIAGLVAATIVTGAAGLTGCAKDSAVDPASKIENIFKEQKQSFQLDYLAVCKYKGECVIDVVEMPDETDFMNATAWGVYYSTEDFFNKIYDIVESNPNGIKIETREIKNPLEGTSSESIEIRFNKQALKDNPDVVELIYSEIKDKEAEFDDFEASTK